MGHGPRQVAAVGGDDALEGPLCGLAAGARALCGMRVGISYSGEGVGVSEEFVVGGLILGCRLKKETAPYAPRDLGHLAVLVPRVAVCRRAVVSRRYYCFHGGSRDRGIMR